GDPADLFDTDASLAGPAKTLARELEQHPPESRRAVIDAAIHQGFLILQIRPSRALAAKRAPVRSAPFADDEAREAGHRDVLSGPRIHRENHVANGLGVVLDELLIHQDALAVPGI